jgi:hypothetical protein
MPMHSPLKIPASLRLRGLRGASQRGPLNLLDIPRVTLPDAVVTPIKDLGLKNPNDLSASDYNTYSASAVGGTLIFMLLLGPITGIFDVNGLIGDFVFSALIGGGALAYAALRKDEIAEYANKFGGLLMEAAGKVGLKDIPKLNLPEAVVTPMKDLDLKNPNDLSATEYNTYSAAAVGGTLIFMLLLGPLTGIFDLGGFVGDFLFSALIGGGACAYASLRSDEASEYANKFGSVLLQGVDKVSEALK